ncbi:MAG: potassium-transporting ATPase subunit KdpC [Methanobacterium paludis]|nr:potassium-transporting ATPase subunit KdpC [Methanobacterium paludis]
MKTLKNAVMVFAVFTILLGVAYPIAVTAVAQLAFPHQANGNLITENGKVVGSELIGQNFTSPQYFHGRPSVIDYNSSISSGSNLGPTNQKLIDEVSQKIQEIKQEDDLSSNATIPSDIVLSSASGLEPYISLDSAMIQVPRIARARGINEAEVIKIINENEEHPIGSGTVIVNVLKLNLALDSLKKNF